MIRIQYIFMTTTMFNNIPICFALLLRGQILYVSFFLLLVFYLSIVHIMMVMTLRINSIHSRQFHFR